MGQVRQYECGCGYKMELFVGVGMHAQNLSVIKRCVPGSVFSELEAGLSKGEITGYISGNRVILCESCREIATVSSLTYTRSDGRKTRYVAPCPKCGKEGLEIEDTDNIRCPVCGENMIPVVVGHWD